MEISNIAKIISFLTVLFLAIIPSIQSLPASCPIVKEDVTSNEKKEYIVILKTDADTNNHFDILTSCLGRVVKKFDPFSFEPSSETDGNEVLDISTEEIPTYIGHFNPDFANNVLAKLDEVEILEESIEVGTDISITESRTEQPNLDRIDTAKRVLDGFYDYPSSAGKGVNIYVVDTGVRITHDEFEGRARYGGYFCDGCTSADDEFGHGTHVSGIAAGKTYGVAKLATIISVRVLNKTGTGPTPKILKGLAFVLKSHKKDPSKKSIVNMSLHTQEFSKAMEKYVLTLTENGIHVVVSAGNHITSACEQTPAAAETAITVGATDKLTDQIAELSNFGKCVDIYAPGMNITSAFNSNDHDVTNLNGTSMATPHVSGTVALIISTFGNKSPANMADYIRSLSTKNVVTKIPDNINNFFLRVPH